MYRIVICILGFIAFSAVAVADDRQECIEGKEAISVAACTRLIAADPKDPEIYLKRGIAYLRDGDLSKADADLSQAISLAPSNNQYYLARGSIRERREEYNLALSDYSKAIALAPTNAEAFNNRGNLQLQLVTYYRGRNDKVLSQASLEQAIKDYTSAIELAPNVAVYLNTRGDAYEAAKDYDKALADFQKAVKIDPNFAIAYSNIGDVYRAKKEFDKAISSYSDAIRVSPNRAVFYNNRGLAYRQKNDTAQAIKDYDAAIKLKSDSPLFLNNRGYAYFKAGDNARALEDYAQAIKLDASFALAYLNRGLVYEAMGDDNRALDDYRQVLQMPKSRASASRLETARTRIQRLEDKQAPADLSIAETKYKRVALVIGNANYQVGALTNPGNDARKAASLLANIGFHVIPFQKSTFHNDLTYQQMVDELRKFQLYAQNSEVALVYFAGHGMEWGGSNFLIPVDVQDNPNLVAQYSLRLDAVVAAVESASKLGMVILDACRNYPYRVVAPIPSLKEDLRPGVGLAAPSLDGGNILVWYAASAGKTASDWGTQPNSAFTTAFLAHAESKGKEVSEVFRLIISKVKRDTSNRQNPAFYGSYGESMYFVPLPQQ